MRDLSRRQFLAGTTAAAAAATVHAPFAHAQKRGGTIRFIPHADLKRSEERRVGKECRSRWSPYH